MEARQYLEDRLFICNPWLARAILSLRKEYGEFVGISFIDETASKQNFEVFYFIETQMAKFEECKNILTEFRNSTADVLCNKKKIVDRRRTFTNRHAHLNFTVDACHTAITKKGFQPVDEALIFTTKKKIREMASSYVYRAQKRRFCLLLTK